MRVRNGATKAILIIIGYALAMLVGIAVGTVALLEWGVVASVAIVLLVVLVLTRVFRGENESDAPRAWWRMTANAPAGFALSGWFFVQTISSLSISARQPACAVWLSAVVSLAIAAAYLQCAIRLTADNRRRSRTRFQAERPLAAPSPSRHP